MEGAFRQESREEEQQTALSVHVGNDKGTVDAHWKEKAEEELRQCIARFIFETGAPFDTVNRPSFARMLEAVGRYGPNLELPSPDEIREKYLQIEASSERGKLDSLIECCRLYGCTLMTDSWKDQKGRSIMNLVIHAYAGTMYYDSKNTTVRDLVTTTIKKLGEESVVQVVSDNALENIVASKCLALTHPSIFWTFCAAHTLNSLLYDMGKIEPIRVAILLARSVTVYMYTHSVALDMMREKIGGDLLRPGVTKFATAFLSLQIFKKNKSKLKAFVNSTEWAELEFSQSLQAKRVHKIINNRSFWKVVTLALNIFEPIVKVLRRTDSDTPSMGWLYGDMEVCKNEIALNLKHDESKFKLISLQIDKKWNETMKTPLHMAGHLLNPFFYYQRREAIERDGTVVDGFAECVDRMYAKDPEMQDKICAQLPLYQNQIGSFGREVARRQMKNPSLDPVNWWSLHGGTTPELKKMAMRILGLTTSSFRCERNWSVFDMIHSKRRNKLGLDKSKELVYVNLSAQLKEKFECRNEDSLAARSMEEGKVTEWVEPPKSSDASVASDDEDDEVFPGVKITWRQVGEAMGVDPMPRRSKRSKVSKKRKASCGTASSSKGKGKGKGKKCILGDSGSSSDSPTDSSMDEDTWGSESEEDEEHEMEED